MRILISYEDIERRVREMAHVINNDYMNESITTICILKGAVMFFSDLVRYIHLPLKYEFVSVNTYGDSEEPETAPVVDLMGIDVENITDKNVLIVEDVIGTGNTLKEVIRIVNDFSPKTLRVCALVDKVEGSIDLDGIDPETFRLYLGFRVNPKLFIIGYGMDNKGLMRNQMDITTKRPHTEHISVFELNGSPKTIEQLGQGEVK